MAAVSGAVPSGVSSLQGYRAAAMDVRAGEGAAARWTDFSSTGCIELCIGFGAEHPVVMVRRKEAATGSKVDTRRYMTATCNPQPLPAVSVTELRYDPVNCPESRAAQAAAPPSPDRRPWKSVFGSAQGGDDTLTGTFQSGAFSGSFSVLLGDAAEMMESTQGGDDTLTGTFDASWFQALCGGRRAHARHCPGRK